MPDRCSPPGRAEAGSERRSGVSRTVLYETHVKAGAKMVPFGGWDMPLHYGSILNEHHGVRARAGCFDVGHMGRLFFTGADALKLLERTVTRNLSKLTEGKSGYGLMCNEAGGVIDDVIVTRLSGKWLMVCNASNRGAVVEWLAKHSAGLAVKMDDSTVETGMVAVQGPDSVAIARRLLGIDLLAQKYYSAVEATYLRDSVWVCRSGYTGEEGFEIILPAGRTENFWMQATDGGSADKAQPAGLGARDTLRLEAGMPLYGHEYSLEGDGISASAEWAIDLEKDFVGRDALKAIKDKGPKTRLIGLELTGRKSARQGFPVFAGDRAIGAVTSGTLSPTLDKVIALAYIETASAVPGTAVTVGIREDRIAATVVKPPFYKRKK